MFPFSSVFSLGILGLLTWSHVLAFRLPIADTDSLREVCSGMWGGKDAYIQVTFDSTSSGQVALIIYEWKDVPYLGIDTPDNSVGRIDRPKTYICTTSAVRSGLCDSSQLGSFITSLSTDISLNSTSIYTAALKFDGSSTPTTDDDIVPLPSASTAFSNEDDFRRSAGIGPRRRQMADSPQPPSATQIDEGGDGGLQTYSSPIIYAVHKTGYYCIGIVPVTLVNSRSNVPRQSATHAEYSGLVLFRNTFDGELPAVEYPKINFYLALSLVYFTVGCGWAYLCFQHRDELLPLQYYISGTIVFLVIEMLAQFAYYRYINKHGGGASSLAFLFVIAILNAARNSLSFFLLLIVSMGLSVVTQSLGAVMTRVRILTAFHFVFGVLYSVGTVEVELDSAALTIVLVLIFPLALTLTGFLMWIIISLNGTIMHLQARKQHAKLQMFQRLWRILILAVIAVAAFFVVSSMSLSNRLDEDYAPNNWKYRWILLDGSLATIYLCAFSAIAWLWRPTRDNVRFAMSQELAQDEAEADAQDYDIDNIEMGGHRRLATDDDDEFGDGHRGGDGDEDGDGVRDGLMRNKGGPKGDIGEENVMFQMGEDSDEEDEGEEGKYTAMEKEDGKGEYRDGASDSSANGEGSGKGQGKRESEDK